MKIEQALGHKERFADDCWNLGNLSEVHGDLDKAKDYWQRSLQLFTVIDAKPMIEEVHGCLAELGEE